MFINRRLLSFFLSVPLLISACEKQNPLFGYWYDGVTLVKFDEKYCYIAADVHSLSDSDIRFKKYTYDLWEETGEILIGEDEYSEPDGMPFYHLIKVGTEFFLYEFFGDSLGEENYDEEFKEQLKFAHRYAKIKAPKAISSEQEIGIRKEETRTVSKEEKRSVREMDSWVESFDNNNILCFGPFYRYTHGADGFYKYSDDYYLAFYPYEYSKTKDEGLAIIFCKRIETPPYKNSKASTTIKVTLHCTYKYSEGKVYLLNCRERGENYTPCNEHKAGLSFIPSSKKLQGSLHLHMLDTYNRSINLDAYAKPFRLTNNIDGFISLF